MPRADDLKPHVAPYSERAREFFQQYESIRFEEAHAPWLQCMPESPGLALDVGSGSGRDARALAARGWRVTAVEPAAGLRDLAVAATRDVSGVEWVDSALPELAGVAPEGDGFGLILLSAVWMHLVPEAGPRAMLRLAELLAPQGVVVMTLRHGPSPDERQFHPCDREVLEELARKCGLAVRFENRADDQLGRDGVRWETVVLGWS
ncbi:methyltransferase domain-containing protein [Aquisalimonas sp. 2447]|uniref:class I SAM-dependent methyltransferase n=1 Tax=Aquisalimonas sp. 2447 TaxID=2740807 RepID=UPI001432736B|nr:class I SAM-dependent methyltransferase [Aquisalimonas sp. 2447]QIT54511.1 methyltransferase domain-containing protein [Aquisalimonas sp. 2447]